ncbi:helix-turn-helix domain-containing protein [Corynebacterium variabile]|uniref:helix-turn-helix transcriptional regulator n=1 Tax=Corynebacterium variabile TaxID=1727 RepID=UPI002FE06CB2
MIQIDNERYLSHRDMAERFGVTRRTIRRWWYDGALPSPAYQGRTPYWPERELNAHLKSKFRSINNA